MPSVAMKGGTLSLAMMVPEISAAGGAGEDGADDAEGQRQAQIGQHHAGDDGAEGHQRADRQVDAAGDDDEGRGDGEHAIDRGRLQDGQHIVRSA